MKTSLSWLRDYINLDFSAQEISEMLTAIGLEVEGMEEVQSIPGGLEGLVVGHVTECGRHPNADKLSLTKVDVGAEELLQIVCGAPNVAQGQKVIVAQVGTTIYPVAGEPWKIKKGKIRGELSMGMICAEDEIGLGGDHDGIIVLSDNVKAGLSAAEHYGLESDTVYDIGLTPNRSDATSHIGVAKDLLAYIKINHDPKQEINIPTEPSLSIEDKATNPINVIVEDNDGCPRFTGVLISGVDIVESPKWIQEKLNAIGVRPINNIVDITNFVLHETGQPLHAYDADKISGKQIRVKTLPKGTKFTSLDEIDRELHQEDIIVCDGDSKGMCIGGVFGGLDSGVTDSTKNIFLEAAHFNAKSIRKTSMRHNLRTDAAMAFEKGSDPNGCLFALKRATQLIKEHGGGRIASEIIDLYPNPIAPKAIAINYDNVTKLIGVALSTDEIKDILTALSIGIQEETETGLTAMIPTDKSDVLRECDVIEEILRIYGFNNVPVDSTIKSTISYSQQPDKFELLKDLKNTLSGKGYHEIMNMSITQSAHYDDALDCYKPDLVHINNTSNIHLDVLRPEMMIPVLQTVAHNHNRQQKNLKLYEVGRSYKTKEEGFDETEYLVFGLTVDNHEKSWLTSEETNESFYSLKQVVLEVAAKWGIPKLKFAEITDDARFDFGLEIFSNKRSFGKFGRVSHLVASMMGVKSNVDYAELDINTMISTIKGQRFLVSEISKFPAVKRDLALVMDESVSFGDIRKIAETRGGSLMKQINLFDVYKSKDALGEGKKSYAVSVLLEDVSKTLKDKDVDKVMKKLLHGFEQELGAVLR